MSRGEYCIHEVGLAVSFHKLVHVVEVDNELIVDEIRIIHIIWSFDRTSKYSAGSEMILTLVILGRCANFPLETVRFADPRLSSVHKTYHYLSPSISILFYTKGQRNDQKYSELHTTIHEIYVFYKLSKKSSN